jgi:hypothetical protein
MTEAEWLASTNLENLLPHLAKTASERKLRLWACACCRRIWHLIADERSRRAVEVAEQLADNPTHPFDEDEIYGGAWQAAEEARDFGERSVPDEACVDGHTEWEYALNVAAAAEACHGTLGDSLRNETNLRMFAVNIIRAVGHATDPLVVWSVFWRKGTPPVVEKSAQIGLLHDIIGNPFRPIIFSPEWRTDTAIALAQTMYESRDFGAMPILADALQDAGCDNDDILSHCRGEGPHVRGCWVVDLLLGKE